MPITFHVNVLPSVGELTMKALVTVPPTATLGTVLKVDAPVTLKKLIVNGPVPALAPPVSLADHTIVWPESRRVFPVREVNVGLELTVTVSPPEHIELGVVGESVTLYEYVFVVVGEAAYVDDVAPDIALAAMHDGELLPETVYHW